MSTAKTTKSQTISFRVSNEHYDRLVALSEAESSSVGDFARNRLISSLETASIMGNIDSRLEMLEMALADVRHDLPIVLQALLISSSNGKPISEKTASELARKKLKCLCDIPPRKGS